MLVNPYHIAHKNRDVLKEFAMEAKITNNNLPANQHDTDTSKLDNLYSLIEKLTSTIQEQTSTIQKQTEAFQNQAKKVEEQENRISELLDLLKKADSELSDSKKLVKTLKTLLSSKEVDLDALRRLLFQGGREQKKDKKEAASPSPPAPNSSAAEDSVSGTSDNALSTAAPSEVNETSGMEHV